MSYNNGLGQSRFKKEWKRLREEYRAAGMNEDAIDAMEAFDWELVKCNRRFRLREEPLSPQITGMETEPECPPLSQRKCRDSLTVEARITDPERRYGWIDELDDENLVIAVRRLKQADLELLTRYAIDGYTVTEIGAQMGMTHQTVSEKIIRIKKFLKNF